MWSLARAFDPGMVTSLAPDDCSRILVGKAGTVVAIAAVSTAPFEAIDPPATRALLDAVAAAYAEGGELLQAGRTAVRAPAHGHLVVAVLGEAVEVSWIGLGACWLIDCGAVIERTEGHSLRRDHGPAAPDLPTRGLGADHSDAERAGPWATSAGMRVACGNWTVARLPSQEVASLASRDPLEAAADGMIRAALARDPAWPAVAIVARR